MSCPATGSNTKITVIEETTLGVTPTINDGDTQVIPRSSASVNLTKETLENPTVRGDGLKELPRHGNKQVGGDISVAYAHESHDLLLANVFQNDWNANVLELGRIEKSLTMQVEHQDIDKRFVHKGLRGNTFNLEVNTTGVVNSTFGFLGTDTITPGISIDGDPTPAPNKQPFTHIGGVFKDGGTEHCVMTGLTLSINNQMDANFALGKSSAICVSNNSAMVEGSITAWFTNLDMYNVFLNEEVTTLEFTLDDGNGNTHTYYMDEVKFNTGDVPVSDGGSLTITVAFVAHKVQITRS